MIKGLVEALEKASELCEALPELNNGNYDHDEVVDLNNGAVELCLFLRDTLATGKKQNCVHVVLLQTRAASASRPVTEPPSHAKHPTLK